MHASRRLRPRGWIGLALVALAWPANWLLPGDRTHALFFPLWLGYVLLLDAWVERRDGSSPWTRSRRGFLALFALSIPLWWAFEAANEVLRNWEYVGVASFGPREYAAWCTLSFSTVVPAVLLSAEWARGWAWIERRGSGPRVAPSPALLAASLALGAALLWCTLRFPRTCYPLLWVSGVFLLEPLVHARGGRGLLSDLARGDWRPWLALWAGGLACGFFWELWNWRSFPKWIYHIPASPLPFVNGPKLFEMPLAGYLGYLPFALVVHQWKELWLREPELLPEPRGAPMTARSSIPRS
jgi:hypothetical protein